MSKSEEYNLKQQPPYIDPALVIDTRLREIEREQAEERKQQQEYNRKQLRFNGLLMLFTGLLFLTSIGSDFLMLRYVSLTRQSADAATSAASTASMALAQSKIDSASQDKRNSEAQKASAAQSRAALDESERQGRISQRPYITVENARFDPALGDKAGPATFKMDFHNAGRTPALRVIRVADGFIDGKKIEHAPDAFPSEVTIASDRNVGFTLTVRLAEPDFTRVVSGNGRFSVKGNVRYTDVYRERHTTAFCTIYDAIITKLWVYCPGYDVQ